MAAISGEKYEDHFFTVIKIFDVKKAAVSAGSSISGVNTFTIRCSFDIFEITQRPQFEIFYCVTLICLFCSAL